MQKQKTVAADVTREETLRLYFKAETIPNYITDQVSI
jgi:hypothetical protein